ALRRAAISLLLCESNLPSRYAAIGVEHGILRVLPALVAQAFLRSLVVFDEPVLIGIAGAVDPGERPLDTGPQLFERLDIAACLGVLTGQQNEQRRCIDAAIVQAERNLT